MKRFQLTPVPARWEDRPCEGSDLELWFGPADDLPGQLQETPAERRRREGVAKSVCAGCPVMAQCLAQELQHGLGDQWGVRGGLTAAERQDLIRARRAAVAVVADQAEVA
ncbi:WhiB family transcriptional regulator [Lentzea tibetensis]|uniref:WhiB family transcriptional regulator n=1 Tax=Lentzea tibetensis TaxID=2591470 RepID=A0A563EUI5_9PSEU|nr:WhiB family transcriptional regulator [Lentzea tibetensis]TWP51252.1 WhiB family transcriptional regulator [Lentzea tibetensis]